MKSTLEVISVTVIKASKVIRNGFPTDEGEKLALYLLNNRDQNWSDLEIDLTDCDSGLLISAFFNAFLQKIHEKSAERLDDARLIHWKLEFGFQRENVAEWMNDFHPCTVR